MRVVCVRPRPKISCSPPAAIEFTAGRTGYGSLYLFTVWGLNGTSDDMLHVAHFDLITLKHAFLATPRARNAAEPRSTRTPPQSPGGGRTHAAAQSQATTLGVLDPYDTISAAREPASGAARPATRALPPACGPTGTAALALTCTRGHRNDRVSGAYAAA
jgi:hypothetical protein